MADVADHAGISRATAYRYFSTPDEIIREAVLDGVATRISVTPASPGADIVEVGKRVDKLVADVFTMVTENEGVFRALLGSSAAGENKNRRGGRRLGWLNEAIAPIDDQLPPKQLKRLVHALSLVTGIEAVVVMRDICELAPEEGEKVLRWAAQTLLAGAFREAQQERK